MKKTLISAITTLIALIAITACTPEGGDVAVESVKLNHLKFSLLVDKPVALVATVSPAEAVNKDVTWSSDKPEVATVNEEGLVLGKKIGTANITVTTVDGGKTSTCEVTVEEDVVLVKSITFVPTGNFKLEIDNSATITTIVLPNNATNTELEWTSDDLSIAVVDAGVVTGKKEGTTTITATAKDGSGIKETCEVTVRPEPNVSFSISNVVFLGQPYAKDNNVFIQQWNLTLMLAGVADGTAKGYSFQILAPESATLFYGLPVGEFLLVPEANIKDFKENTIATGDNTVTDCLTFPDVNKPNEYERVLTVSGTVTISRTAEVGIYKIIVDVVDQNGVKIIGTHIGDVRTIDNSTPDETKSVQSGSIEVLARMGLWRY